MRLSKRVRAVALSAVLGAAAFSLAACGRNGPPEPPPGPIFGAASPQAAAPPVAPASGPPPLLGTPGASTPMTHEQAQKTGFDANGNPVAPPSERKSFFLDFLLQ
jgi:predicted small lipoprotein YifL